VPALCVRGTRPSVHPRTAVSFDRERLTSVSALATSSDAQAIAVMVTHALDRRASNY